MKKIKSLLILMVAATCFVACDKDEENVIFDNINGQTLAFFDRTSSSLPVTIDATGSVDIAIGVTTVSNSDRTINISVIADQTTAAAENYSLSSTSITVPAGEYYGTLTVSGTDNSVETTAETIALRIDTVDNGIVDSRTHNVSIFQVCPVDEALFTGMYLIEQTTPFVDGPTLDDGSVVEVRSSGTSRIFASNRYPNFCTTPLDFTFNLVCNEIIVPVQDTNCRCNDASDWFGPATTPSTYDLSDDSVFFLTFADDLQADCGPTAQTTYRFTKQ